MVDIFPEILHGHVLPVLGQMKRDSIRTIVSSPPYWRGRRYAIPDQIWGGDPDCDHEFDDILYYHEGGAGCSQNRFAVGGEANAEMRKQTRWEHDRPCKKCGAWLGQLGRERTRERYAANVGLVAEQLYRVLDPEGTLWWNIADNYHNRSLQNIPGLTAEAFMAAGFSLRAQIIWQKGGSKPRAKRPKPTYEVILFMVKAGDRMPYYYDMDAPYAHDAIWTFGAKGSRSHIAAFPIELPTRCIRIGCPIGGTVLDPFAGTGTTMKAAKQLDRIGIGIELAP
jgi:DNA modification methylase